MHAERAPIAGWGQREGAEGAVGGEEVLFDGRIGKFGGRIVIGRMTSGLELHECVRECFDILGPFRSGFDRSALVSRETVFQCAIHLQPSLCPTNSRGASCQQIRAFCRQTVKQRIIARADRPPSAGLVRRSMIGS